MSTIEVDRQDDAVRVISIFATQWRHEPSAAGDAFDVPLGRLSEFYDLVREQLPKVRHRAPLAVDRLSFHTAAEPDATLPDLVAAEAWLFVLPSDQVVAALTLDLHGQNVREDPAPTVRALERCAYANITVEGRSLPDYIAEIARACGATEIDDDGVRTLPPERHQVVFARGDRTQRVPSAEVVGRILYRMDPPFRQEFMPDPVRPNALKKERAFGAITPYVSLLYGHESDMENSAFLTAVQAVGTAARFRQIWYTAHKLVRDFRSKKLERDVGKQQRESLEALVDELGNLELDLSFSVETSADLGLLLPSLRIASFYRALSGEMELPTRARTVSQMFTRLSSSIQSEITAIDIRERRAEDARRDADERRRRLVAGTVSVISAVGVPLGFLVAFFGINASQVDGTRSIFDFGFYQLPYLVAGFLVLPPAAVFFALYRKTWLRDLRERFTRGDR